MLADYARTHGHRPEAHRWLPSHLATAPVDLLGTSDIGDSLATWRLKRREL